MKILLSLTLFCIAAINLQAQTTMCFKENHNSLSTIETVKLDGGECNGDFSLKEMKNKNWTVEDTKITSKKMGYDFVYVLKTNSANINAMSQNEIVAKVMLQMEEKKIKKIKDEEKENKIRLTTMGKDLYTNQCSDCHGLMGEKSAYNTSLPLNSMKLSALKRAINGYTFIDNYGNGNAFIMKPYASNLTDDKIQMIYQYLKSINTKVIEK